MNVDLIEKYLTDKYDWLSISKTKTRVEFIEFNDVFVYDRTDRVVRWHIDVESNLFSWFGPGNYYQVIHDWFIKKFGKAIGYDE